MLVRWSQGTQHALQPGSDVDRIVRPARGLVHQVVHRHEHVTLFLPSGFLGASLAAAAVLPLVGCAPGSKTSTTDSTPSSVSTDPAAMGTVTLTTLDTWADASSMQAKWLLEVNAAFTAKYPTITIKRTTGTFDDLNKTLKLKLSASNPPDVVPANNGWQGIGTLAKDDLIVNLDAYAEAYGWAGRIPTTVAKQQKVASDGSAIGTGSWFGAPIAQGGFIAVYYNRAKLAAIGGSVPTTLAEFDALLAKAKAAGEVPMMIGTQDQWLSTTTLFALMNAYAAKDKISDFVYGTSGTAADTGLQSAAEHYQQWATQGYLPTDFAGTSGSDSGQKFVAGTGVFYFYYSDSLPFSTTTVANKFGTFLLPTGSSVQATGATNQSFSIASASKHPDAAALYLDFISGSAAVTIAVDTGVMPFLGTYAATSSTGALLKDELTELDAAQKSDGFVPYFDWSSPTMLDTLGAKCQLLLASKITPAALVTACQKDYDAFRASQSK